MNLQGTATANPENRNARPGPVSTPAFPDRPASLSTVLGGASQRAAPGFAWASLIIRGTRRNRLSSHADTKHTFLPVHTLATMIASFALAWIPAYSPPPPSSDHVDSMGDSTTSCVVTMRVHAGLPSIAISHLANPRNRANEPKLRLANPRNRANEPKFPRQTGPGGPSRPDFDSRNRANEPNPPQATGSGSGSWPVEAGHADRSRGPPRGVDGLSTPRGRCSRTPDVRGVASLRACMYAGVAPSRSRPRPTSRLVRPEEKHG
jgi:hypothetical protein